jgi:hypothetical protein
MRVERTVTEEPLASQGGSVVKHYYYYYVILIIVNDHDCYAYFADVMTV